MPAICWAVMRGHLPLVHRLIDAKVNTNAQEPIKHKTVLFKATRSSSKVIANLLLQNGADIELQGCEEYMVLYLAVIDNDVDLVERLMERGANREHHNIDGETTLYIAAKSAVAVVKLLFGLLFGESVESLAGTIYRRVVVREGHEHIAEFLIEN